jgi:hypothetical protein
MVAKVNGINVLNGNGIGGATHICAVTGSEPVTAAELNAAVAALSQFATVVGVDEAGEDTVYVAVQGGTAAAAEAVSGVAVVASFESLV